jgi:hypothetical protein
MSYPTRCPLSSFNKWPKNQKIKTTDKGEETHVKEVLDAVARPTDYLLGQTTDKGSVSTVLEE